MHAHAGNRGYYTAVRRYEFYFRVVKTIFYEGAQRVNIVSYHEKIKFISSSHRVIFHFIIIWTRVVLHKQQCKSGK